MPAISTRCLKCQHSFRVPHYMAGRTVRCPECKHSFAAAAEQPATTAREPPSTPPPVPAESSASAAPLADVVGGVAPALVAVAAVETPVLVLDAQPLPG